MKQPPRHSPTPWIIEHNGVNAPVIKTSLGYIAVCERARQEADARLIAAAPELLAALKLCQAFIDHGPSVTRSASRCKEAYDQAIARAEGRD